MTQTRLEEPRIENLLEIIAKITSGEIPEAEGRRQLEELLERGGRESVLRRVIRELFPSLSKSSTST